MSVVAFIWRLREDESIALTLESGAPAWKRYRDAE